jgi:hypothetical protein
VAQELIDAVVDLLMVRLAKICSLEDSPEGLDMRRNLSKELGAAVDAGSSGRWRNAEMALRVKEVICCMRRQCDGEDEEDEEGSVPCGASARTLPICSPFSPWV